VKCDGLVVLVAALVESKTMLTKVAMSVVTRSFGHAELKIPL